MVRVVEQAASKKTMPSKSIADRKEVECVRFIRAVPWQATVYSAEAATAPPLQARKTVKLALTLLVSKDDLPFQPITLCVRASLERWQSGRMRRS